MKGNGFDEEDFYITFFVLWSLGVLVVALWSTFLDLKLRRNNRRLTKTVKDQRVNKTVGGLCLFPEILDRVWAGMPRTMPTCRPRRSNSRHLRKWSARCRRRNPTILRAI